MLDSIKKRNDISTYIFVHDQNILLRSDEKNKFKKLPNVKYVFLGYGNYDLIINRSDVIIAQKLPYNIENYPKFCSFTGWYALWKNELIDTPYVNLFEYDITISDKFTKVTDELINKKYDFIGYVPLSIHNSFVNTPEYLANILVSIKKYYDINIEEVINEKLKKDKNLQWSSTSNSTFSIKKFNDYMVWFDKLIDDLKYHKMSGHAHERSITLFNLINDTNTYLTTNLVRHFMLNSHSVK